MLLEIYDWARVPNVKIVYALRDNVLHKLESDFQSPSYQREKLADQQIRLRWSREELVDLIDKRLARLAGKPDSPDAPHLGSILPRKTNRGQAGVDYILDRTLNRPRDIIDFLNNAAQLAVNKNRITRDVLREAEQPYSYNRLSALFDEWNGNYSGLDLVARKMLIGRKPRFPMSDWGEETLLDLFTDSRVDGRPWLSQRGKYFEREYKENAERAVSRYACLFASVMFEVSLIGVRTSPGDPDLFASPGIPLMSFDDVSEQTEIVTHPMFHAALRISSA